MMTLWTRAVLLGCLFLACVCAQTMRLNVGQLKAFLRSSIQLNHPDKQVADYVKKIQLTERLTEREIEDLVGQGLGPRTAEALRVLASATVELPKPATDKAVTAKSSEPAMPMPSKAEQDRIVKEAREIALAYTKSLPNFICLQVTRRYFDPNGLDFFTQADTVAARLSYFDQKEEYKVISVNNQVVNTDMDRIGGATSSGEFGTMMREIFEPGTRTEFWWERWAKLRGRVVHVFGYRVPKATSKWHVVWQKQLDYVPGYKGLMYIDRDVPTVMRLTLEAENMPPSFPIQEARTMLDYEYTGISGQEFLLPMRSEMRMREGKFLVKNMTEFRNYRKFGAEATITFDIPDEIPEEQLKEEKIKQP
jgi:hypothetical protein